MAVIAMIWGIILIIAGLLIAFPFAWEEMRPKMNAARRKGVEGQFVTLSRGVTYYEWIGPARGPVAVCVHGLTTPSAVWRGMAQGMALMGYRVLIYDLYGRGYSDHPEGSQDQSFFLDQLAELLEGQNIGDDITLLGYSMGGAIAAAFAARHPALVRQLILVAPAGMGITHSKLTEFIVKVPPVGDWLMLGIFPFSHSRAVRSDRRQFSSVDNIVKLKLAELKIQGFTPAVLASMRGLLSQSQQENHKNISRAAIPVLAIWGRDDKVIPLTAVGTLAKWSRAARQEVIDGAGHDLIYTHTDAVLDAMKEVLREGLR